MRTILTPLAAVALAACAAVLLAWGIRTDNTVSRWAGIVCLAVAVALRFIKPKRSLD